MSALRRAPLALVLLASACAHAPPAAPSGLDWLVGRWRGPDVGSVTEETWRLEGGALVGANQTTRGPRVVHSERLRIVADGAVVWYIADPSTQPEHAFRMVEVRPGYVRFEDPAHDFPQVIEYRRRGDVLEASVKGEGRTARWRWARVPE